MQLFANVSTTELLGSIIKVDDVADLYRKYFEAQNTMFTICAQNELVRRGRLDKVVEILLESVDKGLMKYGTEFTHMVAMSLESIGDLDPLLSKIGKYIYDNAGKAGTVTIEEIKKLIRVPEVIDINRIDYRMIRRAARCAERAIKQM